VPKSPVTSLSSRLVLPLLPFHNGALAVVRRCPRLCGHVSWLANHILGLSGHFVTVPYRLEYERSRTLHRTKLRSPVTFASLVLPQWLKVHFSTARGSSAHLRLFISDFMIASKVICDDTCSSLIVNLSSISRCSAAK